jgi:hypothetical protein
MLAKNRRLAVWALDSEEVIERIFRLQIKFD